MHCTIDFHILILVSIMLIAGMFGGYLNYLHNFDTTENEGKNKLAITKYILLGIGSAFLVPAFLKMIASDLIKQSNNFENNCYLIFGGFCLIAAIFSRRFITTIGEKILEAAKKAEKTAQESKLVSETTKSELTSTIDRIEDVKTAIDLRNNEARSFMAVDKQPLNDLLTLTNSYIQKTSIPNYNDRMKLKAELGRKMGEIILTNNLPKQDLLKDYPSEGMYLALAYSVHLKTDNDSLNLLNRLAVLTSQLYTKYVILLGYKSLARIGLIKKDQFKIVYEIISSFRYNADNSLLRHIDDTIGILRINEPEGDA